MPEDQVLDQVAQIIADARVECLKLGASPQEIGNIMMDEAALGLMAEGTSMSEIQKAFRKYSKTRLVKFYTGVKKLAER
ncbi:MAG: hypothetical protein O3A21_09505 [Proteobacteria bacterium]|nr:hypothetical protein [Pseudomonadota bacterium]